MGVAWGTEEAIAKADVVHVEIDVLQCNSVAVQNLFMTWQFARSLSICDVVAN